MAEKKKYFRKIPGDKIYLSPMNPDDYEIYTEWINNIEISSPLGNSSSNFCLTKEKEILETLATGGHHYAMVRSEDDKLLGNCSLFDLDMVNRHGELGIFIGDVSNHNKGYGREAIMLILSYGFKILNLNNIMLKVFSYNENAIAAYKKCGFKEFGRRREVSLIKGKYYDDIYMEILSRDFQSEYLDAQLP